MSAVEGGHVTNIEEANTIIREIVEGRNRRRGESTEAVTEESWDETQQDIKESSSIEYTSPVFFDETCENPKDTVGSTKLPMHLWPSTATAMGCVAMLNGALKYGRDNWRRIGVKASIYHDACQRHLAAWFEGRETDEEGVPHLASALACLAIIVDAEAAGTLIDDRKVSGGQAELVERLTPIVSRLRERHADKRPKHWTIADD